MSKFNANNLKPAAVLSTVANIAENFAGGSFAQAREVKRKELHVYLNSTRGKGVVWMPLIAFRHINGKLLARIELEDANSETARHTEWANGAKLRKRITSAFRNAGLKESFLKRTLKMLDSMKG